MERSSVDWIISGKSDRAARTHTHRVRAGVWHPAQHRIGNVYVSHTKTTDQFKSDGHKSCVLFQVTFSYSWSNRTGDDFMFATLFPLFLPLRRFRPCRASFYSAELNGIAKTRRTPAHTHLSVSCWWHSHRCCAHISLDLVFSVAVLLPLDIVFM